MKGKRAVPNGGYGIFTAVFSGNMSAELGPDAKAIMDYLKSWPTIFISGREIARKVGGKKRYADDRFWAVPFLRRLVKEELIESDAAGGYRLMPEEKNAKKSKTKRHVSPQILKILKTSGKSFEGIVIDEDDDFEPPIPAFPGPRITPNRKATPPGKS